jgi:hypothetical protein
MSPANNSGSRPSSRGGSSMQGRSSDRRNSPSKSSSRPSSSRPSSSSSRPGSSRPGSSRPSGSYRDGASSGGRTASGRDSSDRSSYSGRPSTSRGDSSRPSSRPSSDRGERSYGSRDSRPSSDRPAGRSYGDRNSRPSSRPSSDRGERSYGSRDSRPSSDRGERSYGSRDSRPSSDRPAGRSYGDRDSRPSSRPSSDRGERSYGSRDSRPSSDRPSRSYGDRPERRDDRRPSSDRPAGRSYGDRDSRPSSRPSSDRGERSYGSRDSRPSSDRPAGRSYGDRDSRPSSDRPRRENPYGGDRPRASDDRDSRPSSRYSERGGRPDRAGGRFADDREERRGRVGEKRVNVQDPIIPDHITGEELPRAVRNELRTLPEGLALRVARHLAASVEAATVNPEISWQHAKAALSKASRVGIIREAAAEAAYNAGHYAEALIEFRAARRMRGIKEYWPLMADCERACGRPMKAIEMAGDPLVKNLDHASRVEMRIVAAGARMDMGNLDAALATLQCPDLTVTSVEPWSARIRYAYADVLEQMDRREEALEWFHRAAAVDADMLTDSDQRVRKLEGKSTDSDNDDEYGYEDLEDFDYSGEFGDQEDSGDNDDAIKE